MKKSMIFAVVAGAMAAAGAAFGALQGRGVEGDPYLIGSYAELQELAQVVNGEHATIPQNLSAWAVVTNDITTTETDWTPIGMDYFHEYAGTFDGAGHTITGLANTGTPDYMGLFGTVGQGGVVRNVRLEEVAFNGSWAGGVAECNEGTVSNCCVSGSVRGEAYCPAGGIVGHNPGGTVANCYNTAAVSVGNDAYVGGVVGYNFNGGTVTNCHSTGSVSGGEYAFVGGVVGYNGNDSMVANNYCLDDGLGVAVIGVNSGTAERCDVLSAGAYTNAASFSGWDFDNVWVMGPRGPELRVGLPGGGTEEDPYVIYDYGTLVAFAGAVNGGQRDAWGVLAADIVAEGTNWVAIGEDGYNGTFDGAGHTISKLENAGTPFYAGLFGEVSRGVVRNVRLAEVSFNGTHAGGVAGENFGTVSNCCVSGRVRGESEAGGVVGYNFNATVANCHNSGAVSGGSRAMVGGVVGQSLNGEVRNCHSTGAVTGGYYTGGVVGDSDNGTVANSYCPESLGVEAIGSDTSLTTEDCRTLTAAEYTQTNSFSGWDFEGVWGMGPEWPYLRVFGEPVAYPVWVGGKQVWEGNAGDIFGDGTARFEGTATNGTLTLSNAVITNAVAYDEAVTNFTAGIYAGNGFDLAISLDGSNRVENASEDGNGIRAEGNLSLGGAGSLTAEGGDHAAGIYAEGNLRIENTTVTASGITGLCSQGGNTVLTNATVSATGGLDGIYAYGAVAFAGASRVEATTTESDGDPVFAWSGITVGGGLDLVEPDGGGVHESGYYFVDAGGNAVQYVRIEPDTGYELWVGGVQVGSGNAGDILGDGSARFEGTAAGGTLALSNAVVTNAVAYNNLSSAGIYAGDGFDLTISLDGSNQVANAREHGYGILANGNLSLGGAGSLTAEAGRNAEGISAKGNLRIEGTTVAASGVNGVSSGRNIVLTNATVTATGVLDGIYAIGAIAFAGESRVEATATESDGEAIYANDGIALEDGLSVALPAGGSVSGGGVVDAAGKTAAHVLVAYFYELTINNGSTTNQITAAGFDIDITADEPQDGEAFVQWSSNVEGLEFEDRDAPETRFTMPATNVTVTAQYGIVPEVDVSCVVTANGDDDEMTLVLAGPDDCDGVADVAIYEWDDTGAEPVPGEVVWSTNGVALAEGAAELTVSIDTGVVLPGQLVVAAYLPNDKYSGATASNRVMGTSSIILTTESNYQVDDNIVLGLEAYNSTGDIAVTLWVSDGNGGLTEFDRECAVVENTVEVGELPAGEYVVTAVLAGDANYLGSTDTKSFRVDKLEPGLEAEAGETTEGEPVVVTATLGYDDCTGTVTVAVDGSEYVGDVVDGVAAVIISDLAAGDYDATATYSGDDSYLAVSTNFSFTVFPRRGQEEVDGVVWYYAAHGDGTAMVTGVASNHATGNLTMPETLGGWTVTEVGVDAFMQCTNITGMAIAAGVTNIMDVAFSYCTGLTDMTIPDLVTDIGRYAFNSCEGLTNVTVGAGVTNIEDSAFNGCYNLATVSLPEGLVSIGAWAFAHSALADVRIPDSVADIGEKAFYISGSLTNVRLGTGIESVGENAFAYCDALAAVWVPVEQEGTGLLDAAGLPAGCEIHYYGTQTVTFDPNGGTCATATNAYAIGEAYGALPEAGRDGHDFAGWWDDAAGVEVTTNSIVTEKAARTLVAHWKEGAVTYWDPVAGTNGVCTNYTAYTGQTTLKSGWYVVAGAITNDGRIGIDRWERNAEVNLILRDGAELVAKGGIEVAGAPEHHLVVWAQSDGPGAGKLTATAGDGSAGIGGTCDSYSAADGFKHVYGGRVTINGGAVTATGGSSGGAGIGGGQDQGCEWVTVNGGTVEAIGGGGTGGRAIGNGGSRSTYPAVMALHAGAKVLAGDDAAVAAPVAAPNRVAACLEEMYAKIGPCGPHEYEGGACKWCWAEDPLKQIVAEATGWAGTYDGAGHGVTVRVEEPASGARVRYRAGAPGAGEQTEAWSESPVLFTNACNNAAVSVEISAEGYRTVTNHAAVTIRPAALAVTAKDQEYVYNGRPQGEGDTIYDDPVQIAAKVEAAGLKGEDRIGSVELDGQATDIGIHENCIQVDWAKVFNGTNDVTGNYEIGYARGTLTIAPPWQTVTFDPGGGTCGTETNQYRWGESYEWLPEAARTLYTFDGWWATNEAGWARVGTDDFVTESFERTLVARWLEGVSTNGVRWLCATNGEGTVAVTGAVPAEGDLVMPETLDGYTVTAVGGGAFRDCTNITGMAIPDSVTEIGSQAFRECTALTNVTLGAGVTNIGDYAFEGCTALASVAFPEGLAGIEQGAFLGSALTDAKLPDTTDRIGDDVFAGCKALTNVWLGTGIESVGIFAFHLSTNLAAVWVPVEKAGTDLLEEARVPAGCEIHYYGTQTVTFAPNGGACGTATKDYEIGAPYGELPEARREGHSFQGWWATNAAGAVEVTTNSVVTEEASRTLEARWRLDLVALTVEAGRWGRAEAVFGGTTNVVAGGTATNFAVSWGAAVTVRAVPDGGFAVDGEGTAEFASLTNAASVAFAFLPEPTATLGWKYARNANGWFCAQVAIPWHAGYCEAMENLRVLFADRVDAAGKATAYLVDTATVFDPLGTVETHEGTEYRAAGIRTEGFDGLSGGERAVFGVSDATMASELASVPPEERKIALRVVNRDIETVKPLDDKIGFLAWETAGTTHYLAIAPNGVGRAAGSLRGALLAFAGGGGGTGETVAAQPRYAVAFNANGGTGTMAKQTMTCGKSAKLRKNAFKRSGWTFVGWATSKGGKVVYADQASVKDLRTDGKTTVLYAKWAKTSYAVAFDANGGKGTMAKQSMTYGKTAKLRKNGFKRTGWTFAGWATSKGGAVVYRDQASVRNLRTDGKTTVLYAKWAKTSYTVAFDANGGKGTMAKQAMTYGKTANLRKNAFKRTGWTFAGWATRKGGAVVYRDQAGVRNLRTDGKTTTLYAVWASKAASGKASKKAAAKAVPEERGTAAPVACAAEDAAPAEEDDGEPWVETTTSDGSDGSAVADGNVETSWSPEGTVWTWVVLTFAETLDVADVEVEGDNLPEGMHILLSEDAAEWVEGTAGRAQYVWVAFPPGEGAPAVREIRVVEDDEEPAREER